MVNGAVILLVKVCGSNSFHSHLNDLLIVCILSCDKTGIWGTLSAISCSYNSELLFSTFTVCFRSTIFITNILPSSVAWTSYWATNQWYDGRRVYIGRSDRKSPPHWTNLCCKSEQQVSLSILLVFLFPIFDFSEILKVWNKPWHQNVNLNS